MPFVIVSAVHLTINGVPLSTPGWECLNPMALRQGPATRGQDRVIPRAPGVRPYRRRAAPRRHQLDLIVNGEYDGDGTRYANRPARLDANLQYLRDNVTDPTATIPTAVLTLPSGATVAGLVQIEDFAWVYIGTDAIATIDVSIPAGALA